ncbi:inactive LRR receptor-like serine/threonine-protein kinase BIR2 [Cornus florida]|uniref:inactive LRR receptor-like serine/threonine-protein kinase BIR2 n=1 Tax=Cornus florida TaxID=4283 RepID=UPI00289A5BA8|nr:inactive LRR receptor-like serine/threonine-protein kinase BIR2 [Cornus florida]
MLDRGGDEIKILYFIQKLKYETERSGGKIITMNGNHEIMNEKSGLPVTMKLFFVEVGISVRLEDSAVLFSYISIVFLCFVSVSIVEDDVKCLQGVKNSLTDPHGKLNSWTFTNNSVRVLCKFIGVSCWNDFENRLFNLGLRGMHLVGEFPESLHYCHSLQSLDLSSNDLTGSILTQICSWLPFLVTLHLSNYHFTGSIPVDLF